MMTDPIADMLTRVRNALMMGHAQALIPHSRMKEGIARILVREGYLLGMEPVGEGPKKQLVLQLKYEKGKKPVLRSLNRVSKPSRRLYRGYEALKPFRQGFAVRVISTSKGILTDREAREKKVGGEILLEVW